MAELKFQIRATTHCYVGGADPGRPEWLRIPTLRGLLRFWYRAKLGIVDTKHLFDLESRVFGSTRHGQGVRILPRGNADVRWRSPGGGVWRKYLGYGAVDDRERKGQSPTAEYDFVALGRKEQLEEFRSALQLLHLFGGVGARSRRGWGSIEVTTYPEPLFVSPNTSARQWLATSLGQVFPDPSDTPNRRTDLPFYPAFSRHTRIRLMAGTPTADAVHRAFYKTYHGVAKDRSLRDTETVTGETPPVLAAPRVAFGLPWQGKNSRDRMTQYSADYEENGRTTKIQRRASPLFFKVLRAPNHQFYGVLLHLKSRFLGRSNARLYADGTWVGVPTDRAVNQLLKGLTKIDLP